MIDTIFKVNNQILKRTDNNTIVNHSKDILKASFTFTGDDWESINKFAIFTNSWDEKTTTHLGKTDKCSCIIPSNCLIGTFFKVTVYGGDLITTNEVTIPLLDSGYTRNHHKSNRKEYKDIFVSIFDKLDSKINNILYNDKCLQMFCDGELVDSVCLNGLVDDAQLNELIQEFVTKSELQFFLESEGYIKNLDFDFETGELLFEK